MEVASGLHPEGSSRSRRARAARGADDRDLQGRIMTAAFTLMMVYRLLALLVAAMMIYVIWRERDWRTQFYAALVFVPFVLRGLGVK
jgi:hypothetical protein